MSNVNQGVKGAKSGEAVGSVTRCEQTRSNHAVLVQQGRNVLSDSSLTSSCGRVLNAPKWRKLGFEAETGCWNQLRRKFRDVTHTRQAYFVRRRRHLREAVDHEENESWETRVLTTSMLKDKNKVQTILERNREQEM